MGGGRLGMVASMRESRVRVVRLTVALLSLSLAAGCGSDDPPPRATPGSAAVPGATSPPTTSSGGPKAAARWETVTTLSGNGPTTAPAFTILPESIQWRARWKCETGSLKVETDPPPRRPGALVDSTCPLEGQGFSIVTGPVKLAVQASGSWSMVIDQQVDIPLQEPPLPAMASARVLSEGTFYPVEKEGSGRARIYQLSGGTRVLRFEDLTVNQNTDLFVWLNEADTPKTSRDVVSSPYWVLGNLKSTVGSQNYEIPADVPLDRVRSVVIWCQPVAIAYAAAALER
jgi:hypothetical protein